jgi:phage repressor protein C with HTH and peptisase S24 domain
MLPTFTPGEVVMATGWFRRVREGDVLVLRHDGLEKVKRVASVRGDEVYVVGDNPASTDSRQFGWLPRSSVVAKVWSRGR